MRSSPRRSVWLSFLVLQLLFAGSSEAEKRRVFVTSVSGTGDLSTWPDAAGSNSLERGDAICRARAVVGGLPHALTYRAWLSTEADDAYCHVQGKSGEKTPGCVGAPDTVAGPWYLVGGVQRFSASLQELTGAEELIYRPAAYDELGNLLSDWDDSKIWTGTLADGTEYLTCDSWGNGTSGQVGSGGDALGTPWFWTVDFLDLCSDVHRLLCFEPGPSETTPSTWPEPASIVFVSSATGAGRLGDWPAAGTTTGIGAGDAICRKLATDAHLPDPDSFIAWLSDTTHDAIDSLTSPGPFRRVDGIRIANGPNDLTDGTIDSSIHVDESGRYLVGLTSGATHTGTYETGVGMGLDCVNWTSAATGEDGLAGLPTVGHHKRWTSYAIDSCDIPRRLYCLSNTVVLFWDGFDYSEDTTRWSDSVP